MFIAGWFLSDDFGPRAGYMALWSSPGSLLAWSWLHCGDTGELLRRLGSCGCPLPLAALSALIVDSIVGC